MGRKTNYIITGFSGGFALSFLHSILNLLADNSPTDNILYSFVVGAVTLAGLYRITSRKDSEETNKDLYEDPEKMEELKKITYGEFH